MKIVNLILKTVKYILPGLLMRPALMLTLCALQMLVLLLQKDEAEASV